MKPESGLETPAPPATGNTTTGVFAGFDGDGMPLVTLGSDGGVILAARAAIDLTPGDAGAELVLMLDPADPRPVILGRIRAPRPQATADCTVDGKDVEISAERQIVLRCGRGSITIAASGKITLRGTHIVSRASGTNRIRGGAIQLN